MFNKKLYCEGIRQSFLFGVFMIAMSTILNCFTPLNQMLINAQFPIIQMNEHNINLVNENPDFSDKLKELLVSVYTENFYKNLNLHYDIESVNFVMLALVIVVPIIMIFAQFKFLGSRPACDFYHAVPVSRLSLVFNFSLSSLTWIFLCMVIPMLANGLLFTLVEDVTLNYSLLLPNIIDKVLISFLVYSALLIGMSITSQVFCASIVAGIILFLPRFVLTMGAITISDITNRILSGVSDLNLSNILDNNLNLLINKITSSFDEKTGFVYISNYINSTENFEIYSYNINAYIYTFVLGLIFFACGCYLFVKRRSEMAGQNYPNIYVHHMLRTLLVAPFVVYLVMVLKTQSFFLNYLFPVMSFTFLIYFAYELIISKSFKSVLKSVKYLPVLVVFGILYGGFIDLASMNALAKVDVNSIKNVSFDFNNSNNNFYGEQANELYDSYTSNMIAEYEFTNPELIKVASDALNNNIDWINSNGITSPDFINFYSMVTLNNKERFICLNESQYETLVDVFNNDEYINTLLTKLPNKSEIVSGRATSLSEYNYNYDEIHAIYDVLYQEYNSLTNEQKLEVVYGVNNNDDDPRTNYSLVTELGRKIYNFGSYKEDLLYFDGEFEFHYGTNDLPIVLALYTESHSKLIYINDLLPQTKKFIIDMFIESNSLSYDILDYLLDSDKVNFRQFNISSLDDKYNMVSSVYHDYNVYSRDRDIYLEPDMLNLFKNAYDKLQTEVDYDNLYIITFEAHIDGNNFGTRRVLLPFTQEEFETYMVNISEYSNVKDYIQKPNI